jgi:hypothetical protein
MTESNPVWHELDATGAIVKSSVSTESATWRAAMTGTEVLPTIQNTIGGSFDATVSINLIATAASREAHAEAIRQLVVSQAYDGIDIDYEQLPSTSRANFTAFVTLLAGKLHSSAKKLSITAYAKTSESDTWDGPGGEDYTAIGAAADWVKLMVATANGATVGHDANGEATFIYGTHTVYFQDANAYGKKADVIAQKHPHVGGFAHWRSGAEDPAVWTRVAALKGSSSPASVPAPAPPTSLAVAWRSPSQISLTWADNAANEDGYRVERCTDAQCTTSTQIAQLPANTTAYTDSNLPWATTYSYRVVAFNQGGTSAYSNILTSNTLNAAIPTSGTTRRRAVSP